MNPAFVALALSASLAGGPVAGDSTPDCTDVYDATARCDGVDQVALAAPSEPLVQTPPGAYAGQSRYLTWGFGAGAVAVAGGAGTLWATGVYLRRELALQSAAQPMSAASLTRALKRQRALSVTTTTVGVTAGLLAGTALVFWAFDPERGKLRFDLERDP